MRIAVGLGKKGGEERLERQGISRRDFILQFVNVKQLQQTVDRKPLILRLYESRHQSVFCQFQYSFLYHDPTSFLNILCHYANFTGPSPISTT
mgnify:CR=1 FL=1